MLRRLLDRLARQTVSGTRFEVIVVTDAQEPAPEAVAAALRQRPYRTRSLVRHTAGVSAARNRGWRAAEAPLVLFLGDDMLPERDLLAEHLEWHGRHRGEEVGVLGHVRWARELRVTPFMHWLEHGIQFDYPGIKGEEAGWGRLYTANVSLKRQFVARVGGFDEKHFPFGYEDLDLGYRLDRLGLRLLYNRRACVEHLHPVDLDAWRRRMQDVAVAERQFVRLHPEVRPWFYDLLSAAAAQPPVRGRGRHLIRFVPRGVPWLGPKVWRSADLYFRQALAESFLAAWGAHPAPAGYGARGSPTPAGRDRF